MHKLEEGILDPSEIHFLQPSAFALESLFCLQHIGIFYCDSRYVVTHPYWESVLLLCIDEGELEVSFRDELFTAKRGDAVVIDCRHEHSYHAWDGLKFHYLHFTGISAFTYAAQLYKLNHSARLENANSDTLDHTFQNLLHLARAQTNAQNEHRMSVCIHMMLCELAESCYNLPAASNASIDRAIRFMECHLTENISLDEIAAHVGLSKYYFNRLFSRYTGMTPHRYFINMRVQYAKRLLLTTYASVEEVAEACGFDNPSNFIRLFKHIVHMTPSAFRKIPF
ncbi:MAG: AraC family transcriptional regulator [Eubacteriales bacterium]|nr:AraC family transcriptional regulator [Eubacteriales bacterium]